MWFTRRNVIYVQLNHPIEKNHVNRIQMPLSPRCRRRQDEQRLVPNQLKIDLLNQHSSKSNPMSKDFNYAKEFKGLDLAAVKKISRRS